MVKQSDLRVLFVVDAMKGRNGVGAYFQDLVAHLQDRVARVELVSPSLEDPHPCQGASIPIPGDATQRLFFPKMRELTALMWEMKPHVVVIPGPGIFSLGAYWAAGKLGIPVCVTFQTDYDKLVQLYWGPRLARLAGGFLNWLNRTLFRGSSAVVTISEDMLGKARQAGARHPQLVGTPLAPEFVHTPVTPLADTVSSVLYVGRLAAEKNIDRFLELAAARPEMTFTVAGDGPQRDKVEAATERLPNLRYLGWCDRATVVRALDDAQVLILPSTVEAFGTVALEALARERLVITAPACGINQWPALGAALVVQGRDQSLAQALAELEAKSAGSRALRARSGRSAAVLMNEQAVGHWLRVLEQCAGQAQSLPKPWPSPTLALLRRLSTQARVS
ncbi:glycosyltransferase [Alloalcanivorax xenomutans]|uniref:Glycosyltransferase n=1 Tax=Alloalcanivorax xenomutans TaxID=1094342 RepID=A0A9Q3W5Y9_9GAMM|nr:glycosyltransferase [Alloalcanivorax xenomutans]KYZ88214.1 glycosyl transferase family 1 [Alcanivorax sp. KX64203]MCE7509301.1 glycosyltransferase [Alloalcanivorax xenomutans]MCE7525884.1 glycosyltransferase [Alloalcanivorax xenomutans]